MKEVFIGDSVAELFVFYSKGKLTINDVCIIDSMLTFGPIKKGPASKDRRDYFSKYYPKDDDMESFSKYWMIHRKWEENAQKLLEEKEIRIWYSQFPAELAGFYYLCSLLDGKDIEVNVIFEDDFNKSKDRLWGVNGWGAFTGEEMKEALSCSKLISQKEIHEIAKKWKKLQEENQDVRTVVNGELVSEYPDYRDGLTSIQRSILQALHETNRHSRFTKSATIIGNTMCYEMHGDFMIYSQITRMVQDFNNPYPLIEGLGKFGKRDNTPPADYRYTEVKLSKYGKALLENMYSANVPFHESPRVGDRKKIEYLPGDFPNVFCNGNSKLLPHNYKNVLEMLNAFIDNTDIEEDKLIELIGVPKFADERILLNSEVLPSIYKTGKGIIKYKYFDSEEVYEDEIEYKFIHNGKPKLMNLKRLVSLYVEYYK